jgi:GH15 family glucan-1,4-alpha-glucosidase
MFRMAAHGFRAVVAESGKMDGGPWGYNLEWVRDASMSVAGAVLAGFPEIGAAMLDRILTRMIADNGAALDSSFHRPPETIELDQNGQLLHALWTHWAWTGSDALIRQHWPRIRATADFALDPKFRDPRTGLVKNSREFWERSMGYGVREGYELAYQAWNIAGWQRAAEMARRVGEPASAQRWLDAAALMKKSFLSDPRFSFLDQGRFIKRRLATGDVHATLEPPNREALPPGMPLRVEPVSYCDPDSGSVYPILLGLVDAASPEARRTLESMETLWNQRWTIGGYGRYHVTGEPDSPGPWPFATLFIARAYLEAGDSAKVWRALRWLAGVPGGRTGAWFEYYGPRPIPPLPPVAIIPWTWAEIVTLVVHHLLGVRPDPEGLTIRPRLLDGLNDVSARLRLNGRELRLRIRPTGGEPSALVQGRSLPLRDGALRTERPGRDTAIEIRL